MKIIIGLLTTFLLTSSSPNRDTDKVVKRTYVSNYENVLGTSLELKFRTSSANEAEKAERAALKEIGRLSAIFSAYDANSEFSRWLKNDLNKPVKVSAELFEVLNLFDEWKKRTDGALDPSAAVAINLWAGAAQKKQPPSKMELSAAAHSIAQVHYELNANDLTATRLSTAPLILNSFVKSYIINSACSAALTSSAVSMGVVNIGGDLVVKGDTSERVNIINPKASAENDAPLAELLVSNRAIATSGNYRRGLQIGKQWYSHIIDPRSAKPVSGVISATVISMNAVDAGALATAFNVLPISESIALAEKIVGTEYLIITAAGKRVESKGFSKLTLPVTEKQLSTSPVPVFAGAEKDWDPKFELVINFDFNAIAGNSHRPFAAVWVEDANKVAVRNLALWYNKTKWIPDLRNWYRINGESFKADKSTYASVTGATRNPGRYTIKWDGKNDKGVYVPQGKYFIIIETSKEHGTDEILRQEMELKKTAKKTSSTGNVELSNITFEFRKK